MRRELLCTGGAVLCVCVLLALGGCLQAELTWTIYPTGDGKVEMTAQVHGAPLVEEARAEMEKEGEELTEPQLRAALLEQIRGSNPFDDFATIVNDHSAMSAAWSGEWLTIRAIGYFRDIRQVRHDGKQYIGFEELEDGTQRLTIDPELVQNASRELGKVTKQMGKGEEVEALLGQLSVRLRFVVPGNITETNLESMGARKAGLEINYALLSDKDRVKEWRKAGERFVASGESVVSDAEYNGFKEALDRVHTDRHKKELDEMED